MSLYKELHQKAFASSVRTTEGGWKPEVYHNKEERVVKKSFSLLNKLNANNFKEIYGQIHSLFITAPQTISNIVEMVFDKALVDKAYRSIYIRLVIKLASLSNSQSPTILLTSKVIGAYETIVDRHSRHDAIELLGACYLDKLFDHAYIRSIVQDLLVKSDVEELCKLIEKIQLNINDVLPDSTLKSTLDEMYEKATDTRIQFMVDDLRGKIKTKSVVKNQWFHSRGKHKTVQEKTVYQPRQNQCPKRWKNNSTSTNRRAGIQEPFNGKGGRQSVSKGVYPNTHRGHSTYNKKACRENQHRHRPTPVTPCHKSWKDHVNAIKVVHQAPRAPPRVIDHAKNIKELLLQLLDTDDEAEAIACWKEVSIEPDQILIHAFHTCLAQKPSSQSTILRFFETLTSQGLLTKAHWTRAIATTDKNKEELMLDFPRTPIVLAEWKKHTSSIS